MSGSSRVVNIKEEVTKTVDELERSLLNLVNSEKKEQFTKLFEALSKLKSYTIKAAEPIVLDEVMEELVRLALTNTLNPEKKMDAEPIRLESHLTVFRVYQASIELAKSLVNDPFDDITKNDVTLLTDTINSLNAVLENPKDNEKLKTLLVEKITEVEANSKKSKERHNAKWSALGRALIILGAALCVLGIVATVVFTGGASLAAVAAVTIVGLVGGLLSIGAGGAVLAEKGSISGWETRKKTETLHKHLTTFATSHKKNQKSQEPEQVDSTASNKPSSQEK